MSARLHATAVLVGEHGVLIRGDSGAGKSSLAHRLLREPWHPAPGESPWVSHLVADDQTLVEAVNGRLLARPHPQIAGGLEVRGHGLLWMRPIAPVVIHLVVDRGNPDRLPRINELKSLIEGVEINRIVVGRDELDPVGRVLLALRHPPGGV